LIKIVERLQCVRE